MIPLTSVLPVPEPVLVTVLELLIDGLAVETVMPFVMELLLLRIIVPVPVIPPVILNKDEPLALLFAKTFSVPLVVVTAPLTVRAEVAEFSIT